MKKLSSFMCALGISAASIGAANASVVMNNWYFSPNGTGFAGAQKIGEYLDINGNAFIDLTIGGGGAFTFTEFGVFNSVQADSNGQLFPINYVGGNITTTFSAFGSGTLGSGFTFQGGTIKIYQDATNNYASTTGTYGADDGTLIGTFNVLLGGGGAVDASGSPVANGQITVFAEAVSLAKDYFFDPSGDDLYDNSGVLAFAFTNANTIGAPSSVMVSEIICQGAGFSGPGCSSGGYSNSPGDYIFVSNNGQFKLATVPEPGSLALIGVALAGLGFTRRRQGT